MAEIFRINPEYKGEKPKEPEKDYSIILQELGAKKEYEKEKDSTLLSEGQFIKFGVLKERSKLLKKDINSKMYQEYETGLGSKTLEELKEILDKTKYNTFFNRPSWMLAFVSVLNKKDLK
jgi:hypothetical protein